MLDCGPLTELSSALLAAFSAAGRPWVAVVLNITVYETLAPAAKTCRELFAHASSHGPNSIALHGVVIGKQVHRETSSDLHKSCPQFWMCLNMSVICIQFV